MRSPSSPSLNRHPVTSMKASTRVILVRHGRSTFNEQGRYQGSSDDAVLTEQGKQTAYQVGQTLKNLKIDAIYASPLKRVKQTVDEIVNSMSHHSQLPIHWTSQLREIDLPGWEGLSFQYVREQLREQYRCWKECPHKFQMPLTPDSPILQFPVLSLYQRTTQFWQEILPQHPGQTLLVVSHGGTNHALIGAALGLAPAHYHTLQQSNCGISELEFPAEVLNAKLRSLNLTHLLGETLPKLKEGKQGLRLLLVAAGPEQYRDQVAERLRSLSIDFCLNTDVDDAQKTADTILQYHAQTVQIHTASNNFPQLWQNAIRNQRNHSPNVITGLVVSHTEAIQTVIAQAVGLSAEQCWRLPIQPGTMSILHYPRVNHHPVLQALNFGGTVLSETAEMSDHCDSHMTCQQPQMECVNAA